MIDCWDFQVSFYVVASLLKPCEVLVYFLADDVGVLDCLQHVKLIASVVLLNPSIYQQAFCMDVWGPSALLFHTIQEQPFSCVSQGALCWRKFHMLLLGMISSLHKSDEELGFGPYQVFP